MKNFIGGMCVGVLGCGILGASQKDTDPCSGWRFDVAVLEAGILTLCDGNTEKYDNVLSNMAWSAGRAIKRTEGEDVNTVIPTTYKWEMESLNPFQRAGHARVRDIIYIEAVLLIKEKKNTDENKKKDVIDLTNQRGQMLDA